MADGKPLIVVFATPAFCLSATCGPIVSELTSVKDKYAGRANFIHVEVVKDPHLLDDGRSSAEWVDTVREWGLPTEPWTFLVDAQGLVRAKFEQFTPAAVMEAALVGNPLVPQLDCHQPAASSLPRHQYRLTLKLVKPQVRAVLPEVSLGCEGPEFAVVVPDT